MPFDPYEQLPVGGTGISVTRLGLGTASIAGLYSAVSDADGVAMARDAWTKGVRYFDTAPSYGFGLAEERLGRMLAAQPRDAFVLSTKVGRLMRPASGAALLDDSVFHGTRDDRPVWDFSRDGVRRCIDESLRRLGIERIDIVFIHDPDDHWQAAIDEAYPALHELRAQGVIRAIGAGMNQSAMLSRFVREADMDILLVAGRYTILDQEAHAELLPLCAERGVSAVIGGIMNSGILVDPKPGATFNYRSAHADVVRRAQEVQTVCERHGVPVRHAAIQFPLAHPAVVSVAAGVRTAAHLDDYVDGMRRPIPGALWDELRAEGLIPADAPVPAA